MSILYGCVGVLSGWTFPWKGGCLELCVSERAGGAAHWRGSVRKNEGTTHRQAEDSHDC